MAETKLTPLESSNKYMARAYKSNGNQFINHLTWTKLTMNSISYDPNSNFSTVNSEYTVPKTGYYNISAYAYLHSDGMWGSYLALAVDANIAQRATSSTYGYPSMWTVTNEHCIADTIYLTAGQKVSIYAEIDNKAGSCLCADARLTVNMVSGV
jgi:hypothetical protein